MACVDLWGSHSHYWELIQVGERTEITGLLSSLCSPVSHCTLLTDQSAGPIPDRSITCLPCPVPSLPHCGRLSVIQCRNKECSWNSDFFYICSRDNITSSSELQYTFCKTFFTFGHNYLFEDMPSSIDCDLLEGSHLFICNGYNIILYIPQRSMKN